MAQAWGPSLPWNCPSRRLRTPLWARTQKPWPEWANNATMNTSLLKPNHRILIVDDNPAIHDDFRKILAPTTLDKSEVQDLKAALFDTAPKAATTADSDFQLVSAFQGQEALKLVEQSLADGLPFAMAFL